MAKRRKLAKESVKFHTEQVMALRAHYQKVVAMCTEAENTYKSIDAQYKAVLFSCFEVSSLSEVIFVLAHGKSSMCCPSTSTCTCNCNCAGPTQFSVCVFECVLVRSCNNFYACCRSQQLQRLLNRMSSRRCSMKSRCYTQYVCSSCCYIAGRSSIAGWTCCRRAGRATSFCCRPRCGIMIC